MAVCECDFYRLIGAGTISPCSVDHLEGDQSGFRHIRLRRVGRIGCIHISEYNLTAQIVGCWRKVYCFFSGSTLPGSVLEFKTLTT